MKKKIAKAAHRIGLASDEPVVAACMTFPYGHKRKSAVAMGAGAGTSLMGKGQPSNGGDAAAMPNGQHFLAMTDRRLLVTTVKAVSTNPNELVAEWPVDCIHNITVEKGFMAAMVTVHFIDGSTLMLDGARSSGAEELHNILG